jgi:pyruvate kinase
MRRTKIVATIGPATQAPETLEKLIEGGMNIARINMSHATHEQAAEDVRNIRAISERLGRKVGILMDTQGPAIRTGDLPTDLDLSPGETIVLSVRGESSEEHTSVDVNYDQLVDDISVDDVVIVDNGNIQLKVIEKRFNQLHCEVLTEGVLGSRRHINLPGVRVNLPALTEKDMEDIELGIELGVDFIAMSFVREAADVVKLKGILEFRRAPQKVIAKLEDQQGIKNLNEIIDVADGIMVARGDLGIECPYEELPIIQRRVVKRCIQVGRPVIVATHMLESMIENPSPTRAEITDVSNAVYEQADAIMLSGETSVGSYPTKCLEVMCRIANRIERSGGANFADGARLTERRVKIMRSAEVMAKEIDAEALVVFTRKGKTARCASWLRPLHTPIFAFTNDPTLATQLTLHWGSEPFIIEFSDNPLDNVAVASKALCAAGHLKSGDHVVYVTEVHQGDRLVEAILTRTVD